MQNELNEIAMLRAVCSSVYTNGIIFNMVMALIAMPLPVRFWLIGNCIFPRLIRFVWEFVVLFDGLYQTLICFF